MDRMDRREAHRALDELIAGRWVVSYEVDDAGVRTYTARRPVGWTGDGNPFERLEAPSYRELFSVIARHEPRPVPPPRDGGVR
ncbi:hypothetical protein KIK06_16285 [Nocardiopsis sp. EMB25]|uniref:hypothetical protein n=1 Tax=Nocardiopsis sp. EMB25 TaxID=2835867 RepID=UPI002284E00E|nr:hypothetical protein [Nocardiopsis sp. EMB25]MCY9785445.1 hypothetical protein [Nocardiopsis sp. EMB25]